jgi:CRISPR-associated protein Cmr6
MTFAAAFAKANAKKNINMPMMPDQSVDNQHGHEEVPMMYRAQVSGRCSLQFASNNSDLGRWTEEWVYPDDSNNKQPHYQYPEPALGLDGNIYRMKIKFPFRVFSNCGQDSIFRPVIGKDGIPFIPGSSIKGLFRRLLELDCVSVEWKEKWDLKIKDYCGDPDNPGKLRFLKAYPVGDWAGTKQVEIFHNGSSHMETRYCMVDVVHPQQDRQVKRTGSAKAIALISLFQPTMIVELSSSVELSSQEWKDIEGLFKRALRQGLGGKTSTGYGLWACPKDKYPINIPLKGIGVCSLLRNNEPEFRPNIFKAALRGHVSRILGGVSSEDIAKRKTSELFGSNGGPGVVDVYWKWKPEKCIFEKYGIENTPVYRIEGELNLDVRKSIEDERQKTINFLKLVAQFAYTMGGFGKSWRRVWHKGPDNWERELKGFRQSYQTRAIGCHWELELSDGFSEFDTIENPSDLKKFLENLYQSAKDYTNQPGNQHTTWKETWHPDNVSVYSKVVTSSEAIDLFHQSSEHPFRTTPAISGKNQAQEFSFSSVWHRMLPIGNGRYLEIVTAFHGDRTPWNRNHTDQLIPFTKELKKIGMSQAWGNTVS